ncbi:hypothetical protein RDABS01_025263 [Bienertia sinuspersici]
MEVKGKAAQIKSDDWLFSVDNLRIRQSPQQLQKLMSGLKEPKPPQQPQLAKLQAIKELEFGAFIDMNLPRNKPRFVAELVKQFDQESCTIQLARNKELKVEPIDVHLCYGLPMTGAAIEEFIIEDSDASDEILANWRGFLGVEVGCPKLPAIVTKLLDPEVEVCDNWKLSFLVLAVNTMIKCTSNEQPYYDFILSCLNLKEVPHLNWAQFAIHSLVKAAAYWKGLPNRYWTGPLPFLMICYFDRIQRQTWKPDRTFPLISCWTKKMIDRRQDMEIMHGFGKGTILDRILPPTQDNMVGHNHQRVQVSGQNQEQDQVPEQQQDQIQEEEHGQQFEDVLPNSIEAVNEIYRAVISTIATNFVKLDALLKHATKFVPNHKMKDDMGRNLVQAWHMASGAQLDQPSQQTNILSQNIELFSSEGFLSMVDASVQKALSTSDTHQNSYSKSPFHPKPPSLQTHIATKTNNRQPVTCVEGNQMLATPSDVGNTEATIQGVVRNIASTYIASPRTPQDQMIAQRANTSVGRPRRERGIFFPVYFEEHFYLYVFNFNDNHLDIIDNKFLEKGIPLENKYYDFPQQMINGMLKYHLRERIEDRVTMMRKMKTRVVEIPWRDNTNFNDCGVFVMRHMETYMGRLRGWECGFSPNSDNAEYIRALWIDYAKQILSDESNNNKEQLLHEVKAFEEKQKKA